MKQRVVIRSLEFSDCAAYLSAARRSRSFHRKWITPRPATRRAFLAYLKRYALEEHCGFMVVLRTTGELVGAINLNNIVRGTFQNASLGYYAFCPHTGQGFMREGLLLVLKEAFLKLKLHRLEAFVQPENHASIALLQSSGFFREGLSRRSHKFAGCWRDHERWVFLAEDYRRKSSKNRATK